MDAEGVDVAVADGVVTLTGALETYIQKCEAEQAAQRVPGVRDVVNDVQVQLPDHRERPDVAIARAARLVLDWHSELVAEAVEVTVEDGWVTLAGRVERHHHAAWAERAVQCLTGVRGVQNECIVAHGPTPADLREQILAVLERHLGDDARYLSVAVEENTVVLKGPVPSRTHRGDIERAVGATPGVTALQNDLTVNLDPYVE